MPIQQNFSEWEHLQGIINKVLNRTVKSFFRDDLADDDITSHEGAVRYACLGKDNDTAPMLLLRLGLFLFLAGGYLRELLDNMYLTPITDFFRSSSFKPQITMLFCETKADARRLKRSNKPKRFRISFELDIKSKDITESYITSLKNKINNRFPVTGSHYCGLNIYTYYDPINGADSFYSVPARTKSEAISFFHRFFDVLDIVMDDNMLVEKKLPMKKRKTVTLLGEPVIIEQSPVLGDVKLQAVWLYIWGKKEQRRIIHRNIG